MPKSLFARALGFSALLTLAANGAEPVSERFGFAGKEVFPVDPLIGQMKAADIDGDGKKDLVLVNNGRSKINILFNRTGATNAAPKVRDATRINDLPPGSRFTLDSIASEKRISSLVVADLNADKSPDLAYYGEPRELVIQYNQGTNGWSALKRFTIEDATLDPYALTTGDLNGDKRPDLALLAEEHVYFLKQQEDGTLAEPEKIPYVGTVKSLQIMDIQGDGREDLLLINWENPNPFRVRFQNNAGQLGPELHFSLPPIRSYWADDLDNDKKTEIITIAQKSGRAQLLTFTREKGSQIIEGLAQGQFELLPLTRTKKSRRGATWADLNGDKRPDLIVAEPDSGQLSVYLQGREGSLQSVRTFSTLTGVSEISAADWDGDGRAEIFLLSADERQIGLTTLDEKQKVAFPKTLPIDGRPLAMAVGKVANEISLAVIVDQDGKRELLLRTAKGETKRQKLNESFKANPSSITLHDVNQDGRADLVVLIPYEKMKLLVQEESGDFEEVDLAPPGGSAEQPWLSIADVDGDGKTELLLAQRNFLRAVTLHAEASPALAASTVSPTDEQKKEESPTEAAKAKKPSRTWSFQVREQINGAASNSRIVGAAAVPNNGPGKAPLLFLLDADRKALTVTSRDASGSWRIAKNISFPLADFSSLEPLRFGAGEGAAVSLMGLNTVGWLSLQGEAWTLTEVDGYETPIKDGFLHDLVSGDLNNDKQKDLVFLETAKSHIDIVTHEKPHQLVPANRWQVFEERTFRSRRNDNAEPREALVEDFTADGKNDLVVLVHDRVILYPQE
ncbi:MAG TPA: VCBS repeat-containing protein [Methylomirabilota bacterium]|nr:VCBS repeat-containing protein [Methylomirabilota bacterium]